MTGYFGTKTLRGTEPLRSRVNSLPGANRPIGPWPIRSLALSLPGTFAPKSEMAGPFERERKFQGAKWPGSEWARERKGFTAFSLLGQFAPRSELANRTLANSLPGPFAPWPIRSLALSLPGPFAPWPYRSLELSQNLSYLLHTLSLLSIYSLHPGTHDFTHSGRKKLRSVTNRPDLVITISVQSRWNCRHRSGHSSWRQGFVAAGDLLKTTSGEQHARADVT